MNNDLKLRVLFDTVDRLTKPLKAMLAGSKELAKSLNTSRDRLKELGRTQKDVASFREMRSGLAATASQLGAARARVSELAGSLRASGQPSRQMTAEFERARQAAARLSTEHAKQSARVHELREKLTGAGISTRNLSQHERDLRGNITATTRAMTEQQEKLAALAEREKKLASARERMSKVQGVAAGMAVGGYAARSTGTHLLGDIGETLSETKKVQNEIARIQALGLGGKATQDAEKYVRSMKMMGTSTSDNMTLMRDSMTIFADEHHAQMAMPTLAKMKFSNEAMFGAEDAHENERKFMNMLKVIELRGGTKDEATFKEEANMVQKVITATGGRVGGDEWMQFINRGGAAAKGLRKDAFFYQMEPLIQEMGGDAVGTGLMSAYQNIYQGKTTVKAARKLSDLGLLNEKGIAYDKMGRVSHFEAGALAGGDLFKASPLEWMEKVYLPALAKKGITDPEKIKDTIATTFTNRTASNLMTTMYMQSAQIHKNEKLNAGAYGIDDLHKLAGEQTSGKELEALARLRDLKNEIGEKIMPMYNRGLEITASLLSRITGFMKEHATTAKALAVALAAVGVVLGVGGTLTIGLAAIIGPLAVVRFSMRALGVEGSFVARAISASTGAFKRLSRSALHFAVRTGKAASGAAARIRAALTAAWRASSPSAAWASLRGYTKSMAERIPAACRAAWMAMQKCGKTAVASMKKATVAARQYTAQLWRVVAAQVATTRAAVTARWAAARQYVGSRGVAGVAVDAARGGLGLLKGGARGAIKGVGAALSGLAQTLIFVGRVALTNPVGLLITGIALAALLVIRYWEPIKAFFTGFWQGLKAGLAPLSGIFGQVFAKLGEALAPLKPVFDWLVGAVSSAWSWLTRLLTPVDASKKSLDAATASGRGFGEWLANLIVVAAQVVARFVDLGVQITRGLVNGITSSLGAVKDAINNVANSTVAWFKEKLGIHSPSRVFATLGGFVSQGAALGIENEQPGVARAARLLAATAATSFAAASPAFAAGANPSAFVGNAVPFDTRAPLTARNGGGVTVQGDTYYITLATAPGQDERAILQMLRGELDRREREKLSRIGSRFSDTSY
jgi:hypothetical protein